MGNEEGKKIRVRIKSGKYFNEFPQETIFYATDMNTRNEQLYQLHYNGMYFSYPKEDCEVISEPTSEVGHKVTTPNEYSTPTDAPEVEGGEGVKVFSSLDANGRTTYNAFKVEPKVSLDLTVEKEDEVDKAYREMKLAELNSIESWQIEAEKEKLDRIKVDANKNIKEAESFMKNVYDPTLKRKQEELANYWGKMNTPKPVIVDGVYQFEKEKLERLNKMQKPTDNNEVKYFIGADSYNGSHAFCLSKEINGSTNVILIKSFDNEAEFKREVLELSKIFKARIITESVIDFLKPDSSHSEKIEITIDGNTYFINRKAWELEQQFRKLRNQLYERQISQEEYDRLIAEL